MKDIIKIATILPYKENYTFSKAQAAAIWVCDFFKYSEFKNTNYIFGNTNGKDYLTKNYINININNLKSKLSSSTNEYCKNFIEKTSDSKFDIIEIHNRPLVFNYLQNKINTKFIIYFHNDPLSMNGSRSVNERLKLLNEVDKICTVDQIIGEWMVMIYGTENLNETITFELTDEILGEKEGLVGVPKFDPVC